MAPTTVDTDSVLTNDAAGADVKGIARPPAPKKGAWSLWNWSADREEDAEATGEEGEADEGKEQSAALWNWNNGRTEPPKSQDASAHGGNANSLSRVSSVGASLWDWANGRSSAPASRDPSTHAARLGMPRPPSLRLDLWNWTNGRAPPPQSPDVSNHGGNPVYAKSDGSLSRTGSVQAGLWSWKSDPTSDSPSRDGSVHGGGGMSRIGSASAALWNWGNGRVGPPDSEAASRAQSQLGSPVVPRNQVWWASPSGSPDSSLRNGNAYDKVLGRDGSPSKVGAAKNYSSSHGGMARNSSFSKLWNWGQGRPTPPTSTDPSTKAGNQFQAYMAEGAHLQPPAPLSFPPAAAPSQTKVVSFNDADC